MKNSIMFFWIGWSIWVSASLIYNLNKQYKWTLQRAIKTGKRKFWFVKIKVHLWENNGQWEFHLPETYKEPSRTYLKNHSQEIELFVEELRPLDGDNYYYFAAIDKLTADWDYRFYKQSRGSFNTFHVAKFLVLEKYPVVIKQGILIKK